MTTLNFAKYGIDVPFGRHGNIKTVCPNCMSRRSHPKDKSLSVNLDTGVFNCHHCGWSGTAAEYTDEERREYAKQHGHSRSWSRSTTAKPKRPTPQPPTSYTDPEAMFATMRRDFDNNNLWRFAERFMRRSFPNMSDETREQEMALAFLALRIGTTKQGDTIFWQVDEQEKVRGGKVMKYADNGHRLKDGTRGAVSWAHTLLGLREYNLAQCYQGLSQLTWRAAEKFTTKVMLVESEKTALIGTLALPQHIWLATGGSEGFNVEKSQPLRGWSVTAIPDLSEGGKCFAKWSAVAEELPFVTVTPMLEDMATDEQRAKGWDIADFLVQQFLGDTMP